MAGRLVDDYLGDFNVDEETDSVGNAPMGMSDWLEQEAKDLQSFATWWEENAEANPQFFPMDMFPGDWDEQYRLWGATQ